MRQGNFQYLGCCVNLDSGAIGRMVDAETEVTVRTFRNRIGVEQYGQFSQLLGYSSTVNRAKTLTLGVDPCVFFHRSRYGGRRCYYCNHSGIEHVFVEVK